VSAASPNSYFSRIVSTGHTRLDELIEELAPELEARGFTRNTRHPLWARNHQRGLLSTVINYAPDDNQGGWVEPFVGLVDEAVETLIAAHKPSSVTYGLRHTLLIGSTRWYEPTLERQPAHSHYEVLDVANATLRWWDKALPTFETRFAERRTDLDTLFNTDHPQGRAYLLHDLHRALRGLAIRSFVDKSSLQDAMDFHRTRMQASGFWDVYGEQVRTFLIAIL